MFKTQRIRNRSEKFSKVYVLLGLRRALREEAYEMCYFWIARALACGISRKEICLMIANPSLHPENLDFEGACYEKS